MLRPNSIATLIVIGLTLILAPLVTAVITAVVQVDKLAMLGRDTVVRTAQVARESRGLLDNLSEARRLFLEYRATGDESYYRLYAEQRARVLGGVAELEAQPALGPRREHLEDLLRRERDLFDSLRSSQGGASTLTGAATERAWADLQAAGRAILAESDDLVDARVNDLTRNADKLQRALLTQAAGAVPAALCLSALFFALVTRPMRELGRAIRCLGTGKRLSQRISVAGPRDFQELGQLLDWLRQRLEQLEEQKMTFLRHVSHELRTPLTTIRAGSELLVEELNGKAREEVELSRLIHANGLQLQRLIEDLLRFSETQKIAGDSKLQDPIDLAVLVRSVAAARRVVVEARGIKLSTDLVSTCVRGDEDKLKVAIDNLFANAARCTPRGGEIRISLRPAGSCAVLDVADTGPGIAAAEIDGVFEPFGRGSAKGNSGNKGTGLELAIAKEYVEAHDGHIRVVGSTVGAHFRVSIPLVGSRDKGAASSTDRGNGVLVGV